MTTALQTFLPGELRLTRGTPQDYRALERFHYRPKSPATWAGVWVVQYDDGTSAARLVAVAVLSYPTVNSSARDRALGMGDWPARRKLAFVNQHVRTISRVIVHPQFRSLGLASQLVRRACAEAPTRYVEAFAVMGRVHPFFEKGGMTRQAAVDGRMDGPVYYLFDRAS
ncbi:MAG: glutamine transporter ATP-binding protein [Phycisphaerales bacterium]|nr:glutamine transporter ATP-binding protein [Phycisphaerales bacterium]